MNHTPPAKVFTAASCGCNVSRRRTVQGLCAVLAGGPVLAFAAERPSGASPQQFMQQAFALRKLAIARGDQPYGAVLVRDDRIIGEGVSAVITNNDSTAHAEMEAIRDAVRRIGAEGVRGATLFGTSRACTMCETGAYQAGIAMMFYGESITAAGIPQLR